MNYYSRSSLAYDFTLFEEDEARLKARRKKAEDAAAESDDSLQQNNVADDVQERRERRERRKDAAAKASRRKSKVGRIALAVIFGIAFAFIVVSIIHGQVQLTELNQQIVNA
ncbi:MAG: hypothetical protein IJU73_06055, partial [Ruminococcus sp.]|nr:hypothetical protein [Ruminococcus sp.]